MGAADSAVVAGSLQSAIEHRIAHEWLDAHQVRRRWPSFHLDDASVGLFEPSAGFVRCEQAVQAHLLAATQAGARLQYHEPVVKWEARPDEVRVTTATAVYTAARLIITPGAWAPTVLREIGLPISVERQVLLWFQPKSGTTAYQPDRFPIYIWQERPGVESLRLPRA